MSFGDLAWARAGGGLLTQRERAAELSRGAMALAKDRAGRLGALLGLGRRELDVALKDIDVPSTPHTSAAVAMLEGAPQWVVTHSMRTYVFGSVLCLRDGVSFDAEVAFIAAQLHDYGLVHRDGCACFAQRGAEAAHAMLSARGASPLADRVADCISMHLNVTPSGTPEARHLRLGAGFDVVGDRLSEVPKALRAEVFAQWPRGELVEALSAVMRDEVKRHPKTRVDFLLRTLGFLGLVRDAERRFSSNA